jgi:glutamyl-tRNA synthetase
VNRANAVVNFNEDDPFDPKAIWLNAEHLRALPVEKFAAEIEPFFAKAGFNTTKEKITAVAPLIQERVELLSQSTQAADFFFLSELAPYDVNELIPKKGDLAMVKTVLAKAHKVLADATFEHDALEATLRAAADSLGLKAGQMFQPIRVAVCGRKNAPPLFATLAVLGKEQTLARIAKAETLV